MLVFVLIAICCGHNPTAIVASGRLVAPSSSKREGDEGAWH